MNVASLFDRIKILRISAGFASDRAVCVAAEVAPDFLRDIRVGRNRHPDVGKMAKVASALGTTVDDLLAAAEIDVRATLRTPEFVMAPVIGEVEAGLWREALEWLPENIFKVPALKHDNARLFGLQLAGDSMNKLYPLAKTVVICAPFADLEREPKPDDIVIAQRRRHELFEATCKVFEINNGAPWLEPRSTNPVHKPIRLIRNKAELTTACKAKQAVAWIGERGDAPRDVDTVEITARVMGAYTVQ